LYLGMSARVSECNIGRKSSRDAAFRATAVFLQHRTAAPAALRPDAARDHVSPPGNAQLPGVQFPMACATSCFINLR
jgi:hypothetical protein